MLLDASGATEPGLSLKRQADDKPWAMCRRPWSLMYFTAHGTALPCCIAPFSTRGYENYTLGECVDAGSGGDLERAGVSGFPQQADERRAAEAVPGVRAALEPLTDLHRVAVVIPTWNEAEAIGAVVAEVLAQGVGEVIVADGSSSDGTKARRGGGGGAGDRLRARLWPGLRDGGGGGAGARAT